jgi:hypothetical protein
MVHALEITLGKPPPVYTSSQLTAINQTINVTSQHYDHKPGQSPAMAQHHMASLALCHREVSVGWNSSNVRTLTSGLLAGSSPSSPSVAHHHANLLRPTTNKQSYRTSPRRLTTNHRTPPQQQHHHPQRNSAHPSHTTPHPPSVPTCHAHPRPLPSLKDLSTTRTWKPNSHRSVTNSAAADFQACWNYVAAQRALSREKGARHRTSVR